MIKKYKQAYIYKMKYMLVLLVSVLLLLGSCSPSTSTKQKMDAKQETALYYLLNKSLISDTFSRMLFQAPIDFRAMDPEEDLLYFVFSKKLDRDKMLQSIARDTSKIEFAPCENGDCYFGGLRGNVDKIVALRIQTSNLRVDTNMYFPLKLNKAKDSLSFEETHALLDTAIYYGGKQYFDVGGMPAANLGALVMKKNESSPIYKIAQRLKKNATKQEKIIQNVQDFVANEITYSYADIWYRREIFQRAHEVLISGFGDCSGKTVLMASLLEQLDIPYQILYYKNHVNIGVLGNFSSLNKYNCEIGGDKYYLSECTCVNFQIGTSLLEDDVLDELSFYQYPKKSSAIYDYIGDASRVQFTPEEALEKFGR